MAVFFSGGRGRGRLAGGKGATRVEGLDTLLKSFDKMKSKSDSVMTRQIHLAAERIAERANRDVPVDLGKLIKSINVVKRSKLAEVKVDAPYASYVERGTKNMKAQPYIFKHIKPSLDKMGLNIIKLITL